MAGIDLGERRSTPDDLWVPVSREQVRDWRKNLPKGWRRETDAVHRPMDERVEAQGDQVTLTSSRPTKPKEARDTVAEMARDIAAWARSNPDRFMERVKFLKQQGQMDHLTDEQAANDLLALAEKLARDSARRVYEVQGYLNPVEIR